MLFIKVHRAELQAVRYGHSELPPGYPDASRSVTVELWVRPLVWARLWEWLGLEGIRGIWRACMSFCTRLRTRLKLEKIESAGGAVILFCVLVVALVYALLRPLELISPIALPQPEVASTTTVKPQRAVAPNTGSSRAKNGWWQTLKSDFSVRPYALLSRSVLLAWLVISFLIFLLWSSRATLHRIHIIFLQAHEPFPLLLPDQRNSRHEKIYAVRLLTIGANDRYMSCVKALAAVDSNTPSQHTSRDRKFHQECERIARHRMASKLPVLNVDSTAISLSDIGEATRFTCMLHKDLVAIYFTLLLFVVLLPSLSWTAEADKTQFPLIMAGFGFVWTCFAIYLHGYKINRLEQWDRQQLGFPFDGAPVFEAVSEAPGIVRGERHYWQYTPPSEFTQPAKVFGLDHLTVQQLALAGLLVTYLMALSLIK